LPGAVIQAASEGPSGSMDDAIRLDVEDYMPANNLTRTDRAAMAHGLELRAPFLDVELASFCMTLPYRLKVSTRADKIVMREAFSQQWPVEIRNRSKQGFGAPLARWLEEPAIRDLEVRYLADPNAPLYSVMSRRGVDEILRKRHPIQKWTLLVLGVWLASLRTDAPREASYQEGSGAVLV
jgi:asparagine synthase (glutamine-hydrolysing)